MIFTQEDLPKETLLLLSGGIAPTPDASEPSLWRVASPGSILGLPANLSSKPYGLTAVTIEASEIAVLPRKRFMDSLRKD